MKYNRLTQIADIGLSAPAVRALHGAGYQTLSDLAEVSGSELMSLHGFGPKAQERLDQALADAGLREKADAKPSDPAPLLEESGYVQVSGLKMYYERGGTGESLVVLHGGMPVTSLQRYLGHEDLDTTMLYAEVADPPLQKDYYQGISAFDPATSRLAQPGTPQAFRKKMEQLLNELKTSDLAPERKQEILEQMQLLLDQGLRSRLDDNH